MVSANFPPKAVDTEADDKADDEIDDEFDDVAADGDEIIFLDETETWALWLPVGTDEGVVVHAHGAAEDGDDAEHLFFECEAVDGPDGKALVICTECDAAIPEAEIEALIVALSDEDPDEAAAYLLSLGCALDPGDTVTAQAEG